MTKPAAALPPSDPPPDHPSEIEAAAAAGTLRALIARRYRDGDDERLRPPSYGDARTASCSADAA